ncbi:MAG: alpha-amylase family glycosyl hydrolase [Clostridia bacterium]|nr:alpha-amylase family glycosyl hydrolase [Clostridia bacterium]
MSKWFEEAVFYHIYPLGFCGALYENDYTSTPLIRLDDINDEWQSHISDLGIGAVLLGPIFESKYHGYDTADFFLVDRRLGSNTAFKDLVAKLHSRNIKVVLDGVFNHVGRDFWAFRDVRINGINSKYANWFYIHENCQSPYHDTFSYESWEGHYDLVRLNLTNTDVRNHILSAVSYWIKEFDIDGIRVDVAYCIEPDFLRQLSSLCKSEKSDFWLMGEMIHGDYNKIVNSQMLDSSTNYECYKGLYSSHNDRNYFEIAYSLNRQFGDSGIYKNLLLYNFVDNHDVNRVASVLSKAYHLYPLYAILFTMPGIPSIYYGSEWGIEGKKDTNSDIQLRPRLNLKEVDTTSPNRILKRAIISLSQIRRNSAALKYGDYRQVLVRNEQLIYERTHGEEHLIIALNLSEDTSEHTIPFHIKGKKLVDLVNRGDEFYMRENKVHFNIHPSWVRILSVQNT